MRYLSEWQRYMAAVKAGNTNEELKAQNGLLFAMIREALEVPANPAMRLLARKRGRRVSYAREEYRRLRCSG